MDFYVGSYTRMGGPGIAVCSFDGNAASVHQTVPLPNPTYVILSEDQQHVYAISSDAVGQAEGGSYASYKITGQSLAEVGRFNTCASGPCHLCYSPDSKFLYTANYFSGSISVFPLDPQGDCIQLIKHKGSSIHPVRQTTPHVHQVTFIPGTRTLAAVDLGLDMVVLYEQNAKTGLLSRVGQMACPAGFGPRHLAYGKNGTAYLVHELASTVSLVRISEKGMELENTWSVLPDGWQGENTSAAVRIAGNNVFVSNRGHDSIAVFAIGSDGFLDRVGIYSTGGNLPRDFYVLPDNNVIIAHQGGNVAFMKWSNKLGKMTDLGVALAIPGAVCICPRQVG